MSRVSSSGDCRKDKKAPEALVPGVVQEGPGLFHVIQQLAAAENALWNILDGLKSNTTHASFFCREYWGSSASQAQLSLEKLAFNERLKRQVQQACVLESLSLGVASHLCSGVMQNISVTIRSRLRNLLYYIHENCLVLLDMVCQRWLLENQNHWQESSKTGHCPENLNLDILVRVKRYRRLRRGEHVMALRQHNEMIVNVVRQLCRGATPKRPPLSGRGAAGSPGDRSPGVRPGPPQGGNVNGVAGGPSVGSLGSNGGSQLNALIAVNDILTARMPLDRLRASSIRSKMLQYMCFRPLLNIDGADPDCPWPTEDPYVRYGAEHFAVDGPTIWFEPLPPMLPNLEQNPKLPPAPPDAFTLVLDLDETLVHYFELDGMGNYDIRPGMHEFLERMSQLGYEIVIFTAATQDYADWVIDQIDPTRLVHHRLYRQHALPWGPIFVKDLSRLGRELDRTLIVDNVQENFMLQPHNGIFICTWYDDPHDTALFALTPLLDELIATRARVPEILDKYRDQIPTWAGFDQFSQLGPDYAEFDTGDDGYGPPQEVPGSYPGPGVSYSPHPHQQLDPVPMPAPLPQSPGPTPAAVNTQPPPQPTFHHTPSPPQQQQPQLQALRAQAPQPLQADWEPSPVEELQGTPTSLTGGSQVGPSNGPGPGSLGALAPPSGAGSGLGPSQPGAGPGPGSGPSPPAGATGLAPATGASAAQAASHIPSTATQLSPLTSVATHPDQAAPAATGLQPCSAGTMGTNPNSAYAPGRYQPQQTPTASPFIQQRPQSGGYPPQQQAAKQPMPRTQAAGISGPFQAPPPQSTVAAAPRPAGAHGAAGRPAPAFSSIAGPYQAPPPAGAHPPCGAAGHAPMGAAPAMWSRTPGLGPYQATLARR